MHPPQCPDPPIYTKLHVSPMLEPPFDQHTCMVHYCECKPSGVCCCPWHADFGTKQDNALRAVEARKGRGKNKEQKLVGSAVKKKLGHPAP